MHAVIAEHVAVPAHIEVCANMCRYDLLYGPAFARLPKEGVEKITDDDLATLYDDANDMCEEGDTVVEVYTSDVGAALRLFIDDMPSTLYYDADCECVMDREPEGEEIDGEWYEPSDYYALDRGDIVEAVFGRTIAREFS